MATERTAKKAVEKAKKDEEMIRIRSQIELWMARNHLPDNLKERIITCIQHKLEKNNDIDMDKPMSHLSKDLITEIKHRLCLPLLKNVVQNLENQGGQNLSERICEYLKPKYYAENIYILQEGQPLIEMVFITQGSVWCFKGSNGHESDHINTFELYGEELVKSWLNRHYPSLKELPTSTKTVKTESKVEAFALMASDLKHLVPKHTRAAKAVKDFAHEVIGRLSIKENAPKS
ncbi:hypothetical protein FH972_019552 [Carpinus fangiana]|uniref:Cyclic nucleotide-binding domain-containing protein n=1 Tax=Carpinus fangiana TaxID=176857 RepID=A0A5N6RRZ3_9ROSI|nr:hypothetical protein FH972_019552 [Carpinus fangiana]